MLALSLNSGISALARPKSQIFKSQLLLTNKFLGFLLKRLILNPYVQYLQNAYILILLIVSIRKTDNVLHSNLNPILLLMSNLFPSTLIPHKYHRIPLLI